MDDNENTCGSNCSSSEYDSLMETLLGSCSWRLALNRVKKHSIITDMATPYCQQSSHAVIYLKQHLIYVLAQPGRLCTYIYTYMCICMYIFFMYFFICLFIYIYTAHLWGLRSCKMQPSGTATCVLQDLISYTTTHLKAFFPSGRVPSGRVFDPAPLVLFCNILYKTGAPTHPVI